MNVLPTDPRRKFRADLHHRVPAALSIGVMRTGISRLIQTFAAGLILTATGCGGTPRPVQPEGKIQILPERPSLLIEGDTPAALHAATCAVRTVTLPLNRPIETAWAELDEGVLPDLSRAVWNANGLRLGVLDAGNANAFGEALGTPDSFTNQALVAISRPTQLRESPRLRADFVADLTRPPAPRRVETFTGGRARMLISTRPSAAGVLLELTPQHFVPRQSLLVRTPLEKLLDGRVFEELAASVRLGPGQALVLGYSLPVALRPPPPDPDDAPDASPDTAGTETDADTDEDAPPPDLDIDPANLPLDLGRALLTVGNTKREQQRLIVITATESQ